METRLVYYDETGDDGIVNSPTNLFVLTNFYIPTSEWQHDFDLIRFFRKKMKEEYGLHAAQEMHTKNFIRNKNPYHKQGWSDETRKQILSHFVSIVPNLSGVSISTVIDKRKITTTDYKVLDTALRYSIQRIENDSAGDWNYIIVTDQGRTVPMRKTARAIRVYNPIQSQFDISYMNKPIKFMVEDIFEKDSAESYFIQICDLISYFVYAYQLYVVNGAPINKRVQKVIDKDYIKRVMDFWKKNNVFNLKANPSNEYGLVVYPR